MSQALGCRGIVALVSSRRDAVGKAEVFVSEPKVRNYGGLETTASYRRQTVPGIVYEVNRNAKTCLASPMHASA